MGALKALVSFYTIFHMDITQDDMDDMEYKFYLTPLVGFLFGILLLAEGIVLVVLYDKFGFGNGAVMAMIMLLTAYAGSKFLHFDGLTDFGDGMIVSGTREDHIRALKDTLVGAGGIGVALVTVCCSIAFYAMYENADAVLFLPLIEVFVKNAMVFAASFGQPGNGMAARQVSETGTKSAVISFFLSIILAFVLLTISSVFIAGFYGSDMTYLLTIGAIVIAFAAVISSLVGYMMSRTANRVFGMVNGDILGATNEVCRPFLAFFMLLVLYIVVTVI